jgi:hypothetical protein
MTMPTGISTHQALAILDNTSRGTNIVTYATWRALAEAALYRLSPDELREVALGTIPDLIKEQLEERKDEEVPNGRQADDGNAQ